MERVAWTDERLDDLAARMDAGFARIDRDVRELRGEIVTLRTAMNRVGAGIIVALIGVIAAVFAKGG